VAQPLRFSRWKRIAGLKRAREHMVTTHLQERDRLTLYLPGRVIERAETLAARSGLPTVQAYCEGLLERAIAAEHARIKVDASVMMNDVYSSLDEMIGESGGPIEPVDEESSPENVVVVASERKLEVAPQRPDRVEPSDQAVTAADTLARLLHHAALDRDPASNGFLGTLRRGERPSEEVVRDLDHVLAELDGLLRGRMEIDRRIAYTLHRLALEAQVLLSDAWTHLANDRALVDQVYAMQQAVDHILSGHEISYPGTANEPTAEPSP
jgi:hypothetical protein